MDGSAPTRADDDDSLCLPPVSPPQPKEWGKRILGPPPQPSLPAVRQAILNALAQPPPARCPHCRRALSPNNLPK